MTTAQRQVRLAVIAAFWDEYGRVPLVALREEVSHFARRRGLSKQEEEEVVTALLRDTALVTRSL